MVAALLSVTACGGNSMGSIGDVLGTVLGQPAGATQGQVAVEVVAVNQQQQVIQVATQDGQTGAVRYDQNTVVIYRQQQYPVTALERGDLAVMHIQDVQGTPYVTRVEVQQSVQERTGTNTGSVMQLAGRVAQINHNAGTFVLQTGSGNMTVVVPSNAPQATQNYFHQLRNGNQIRLEATAIDNSRVQVYRFL